MKHYFRRIIPLLLLLLAAFSFSVFAAGTPGKVNKLKASTKNNTVTLSWKKATGAKGYLVYSVDHSTGEATQVKRTSSTSCKIKNLTYGQTYYFKVCAYNSSNATGSFSSVVSVTPKLSKPSAPKNLKYTALGNQSITLSWSKVSGASGYVVQAYNSSTKKYETLKTLTSNKAKATIKNLTAGKTYKLRVLSYRKSGSAIAYSSASNIIKVKAITMSSEAASVRTCRYTATVKKTVTATYASSGKTFTLKKGTKITVTSKSGTTVTGYYNKKAIRVSRSALKYTGLDGSSKNDYSTSVKEEYVNSQGFSSKTNYLIWVSQYKYRVNIFKGSKGNWTLVKSWSCVVGSWENRTPSGMKEILAKVDEGMYNAPTIYFSPGDGTNSNPQGAAFHGLVDSRSSGALSHACVRLKAANVWWIYYNCPTGTAVWIY